MPNFLNKTVLSSIFLGVTAVLGFTLLAQAHYEEYYLVCDEINSCDLVGKTGTTTTTISRYVTEPVVSCSDADTHSEITGPACTVRLSVSRDTTNASRAPSNPVGCFVKQLLDQSCATISEN